MDTQMKTVQDYNPNEVNLLVPSQSVQQISPYHVLRVSEVKINPDPNGGEVFKVGSRGFGDKKEDLLALAKPALRKISQAAGIIWSPQGREIEHSRNYVTYKAIGAIKMPDGTLDPYDAQKTIDLEAEEEKVYESQLNKAYEYSNDKKKVEYLKGLTPEQWAHHKTRSEMIQRRASMHERAESGAKNRVIRDILSVKSTYTPKELSKPFVVPRIDFSPDYSDPEVRAMMIQNGAQVYQSLFSGTTPSGYVNGTSFQQQRPALQAPKAESNFIDCEVVEAQEQSTETKQAESPKIETAKIEDTAATAKTEPAKTEEASITQSTSTTTTNNGKTEYIYHCAKCGKGITEKVHNYCKDNHNGVDLCYSCQNKEVAA